MNQEISGMLQKFSWNEDMCYKWKLEWTPASYRFGNQRITLGNSLLYLKDGLPHGEESGKFPAYEDLDSGVKQWWFQGRLHRFDGPAVIGMSLRPLYFWHGRQCCELEWEFERQKILEIILSHTLQTPTLQKMVLRFWCKL
jgi:hypothetical protein